jgi:hypothetical protein
MSGTPTILRSATLALVALGCALRLVQFGANSSLWLDELQLARNIVDESFTDLLTTTLSHWQVAPPAFLAIQKALILLFGPSDWALRIVPLVASLLGLMLFERVAKRLLSAEGAVVAVGMLALSPLLVHLGSVVKQYSTDVFATVAVMWIFLALCRSQGRNLHRILLGIAGGLLSLLSTPVVVVSTGACLALGGRAARSGLTKRTILRRFGLPLAVWATVALAGSVWATRLVSPSTTEFMTEVWSAGFAPSLLENPTWIVERAVDDLVPGMLFSPYMGDMIGPADWTQSPALAWSVLGLALIGVAALAARKRHAVLVALTTPAVLTLGLSRIGVYPISERTTAFLLPVGLLLVARGVQELHRHLPYQRTLGLVVLALILAPSAMAVGQLSPPYSLRDNRALVQWLARNRATDDVVYAHYGAVPALEYYGRRLGIDDWVAGTYLRGPPSAKYGQIRTLLQEVDRFRGSAGFWVVFGWVPGRGEERAALLCYLDAIGEETLSHWFNEPPKATPVSAHRYDLGDSPAAEVDAERFVIPEEGRMREGDICR